MASKTVAPRHSQPSDPVPEMAGRIRAARLEMAPLNLDGPVGGGVVLSLRCSGAGFGEPPELSSAAHADFALGAFAAYPPGIWAPEPLALWNAGTVTCGGQVKPPAVAPGLFVLPNSRDVASSGGQGTPPAVAPGLFLPPNSRVVDWCTPAVAAAGRAREKFDSPRTPPRGLCRFDKTFALPPSGSSARTGSPANLGRGIGAVEACLLEAEVVLGWGSSSFAAGVAHGHVAEVAPSGRDKFAGRTAASEWLDAGSALLHAGEKTPTDGDDFAGGKTDCEDVGDNPTKKKKKTRYCKKTRDQYRRLVDRIIADVEAAEAGTFVLNLARLPKSIAASEDAVKSLMATVMKFAKVPDAADTPPCAR